MATRNVSRITKAQLVQENADLAQQNEVLRHRVSQLEADLAAARRAVPALPKQPARTAHPTLRAQLRATAQALGTSVRLANGRIEAYQNGRWEVLA